MYVEYVVHTIHIIAALSVRCLQFGGKYTFCQPNERESVIAWH